MRIRGLKYSRMTQVEKLNARQGGSCALCGDADLRECPLVVDHDHATDLVRGLLCRGCNRLVGIVESGRETKWMNRSQIAHYLAVAA